MLAHLEALMAATDIGDVWALHLDRMEQYGFTRLIYGFTRFRTARSFGDPADLLVLSNFSNEYLEVYIEGGLYLKTPMVRWAAANVGALSWSMLSNMIQDNRLTDEETEAISFARDHGVRAGFTISFHDASVRAKGAVGLCAESDVSQAEVDRLWTAKGREILLLNNIMHMRISSLPFTGGRRHLTPRQREVLEWVGDGKTTQDIATIMGVAPATVEKHLRLAREALDVATTAQAVLKAAYQNQIFVLPPLSPIIWTPPNRSDTPILSGQSNRNAPRN